jgi:hypothetical protein
MAALRVRVISRTNSSVVPLQKNCFVGFIMTKWSLL